MNRALLVLFAVASLAACSSTEPTTIELDGRVDSIRASSGVQGTVAVLIADATFTHGTGLSSPINIVVGPSTLVYLGSTRVPASAITVGDEVHAVVGGNVQDSQPQSIGATRVDITASVSTDRLH